jgi:hypothetical protein
MSEIFVILKSDIHFHRYKRLCDLSFVSRKNYFFILFMNAIFFTQDKTE